MNSFTVSTTLNHIPPFFKALFPNPTLPIETWSLIFKSLMTTKKMMRTGSRNYLNRKITAMGSGIFELLLVWIALLITRTHITRSGFSDTLFIFGSKEQADPVSYMFVELISPLYDEDLGTTNHCRT
ncbi:hypothetical protein HanRHA438_Chr00c12g0849141 [Helianthus annuus]|nr:hypothetical protein HanHA300_Chr13g0505931 [Helianthus annuus]KAJ0496122.1 hypothetical protein HanHA89_Chr13g0496121 [Helianthus annuus]KAJ0662183.1 hypothetical protein HanLR1_Chr13g0466601 [Helianthus annuus]KAJ0954597.1 hypothetical protein HanRHA438_Chr00c12g0849141 [Helianthus annuus]